MSHQQYAQRPAFVQPKIYKECWIKPQVIDEGVLTMTEAKSRRDRRAYYIKEIERLKKPENIRESVYASSPHVLMKAFKNDLTVGRLIRAGREVVPLIDKELKRGGLELPEISLACFAYILQEIDLKSASEILKPLFVRTAKKPMGFFSNFAAHALRQQHKLPIKPLKMRYTKAELLETLKRVSSGKRPRRRRDKNA